MRASNFLYKEESPILFSYILEILKYSRGGPVVKLLPDRLLMIFCLWQGHLLNIWEWANMNIDIKIGLTGADTEVTHNGETIDGIAKLEIVVLPNEVTIAKLWILAFDCDDFAVNGVFHANDVNDGGKLKRVKNIEFEEENSEVLNI